MDEWYCVDNVNLTYAYGVLDRYNLVNDIKARVTRRKDGKWSWEASSFTSPIPYGGGAEPSKELAQQAAEKFLQEQ